MSERSLRQEAGALADAGHDVDVTAVRSHWVVIGWLWRVRGLGPDLVQVCAPRPLLAGWLASRVAGGRHVWHAHGARRGPAAGRPSVRPRLLGRFVARRCAAVVAQSQRAAASLQTSYGLAALPVVVRDIPARPAHPQAPARLRERLGLGPVPLVVAPVEGLDRTRADALLRALTRTAGEELVLLGADQWPYARDAQLLSERLRISTRVHLLRGVPEARLSAYMAEADVGVCLRRESRRTAAPLDGLFHCLGAGTPVVAEGTAELSELDPATCLAVAVDAADPSSVAQGIRRAGEIAREPRPGGRELAVADATWTAQARALADLYERLESAPAGRRPSGRRLRRGRLIGAAGRALRGRTLRHPVALASYLRGRALGAKGSYDRSAAALTRARRIDPTLPAYGLQLAASLRDALRPSEAIEVYREVLYREPRDEGAAVTAAINLARLGARSDAEGLMRALLSADAKDGRAWASIAEVQAALGELQAARESIDNARDTSPEDRVVLAAAARVLDQAGEPSEALAAARAAGETERERRLTGVLRTLDPDWAPTLPAEPAPEAVAGGRVLHLLETSLPYASSGYSYRTRTVLDAQLSAGLAPVAATRLGFPANRGFRDHAPVEDVGGVMHHRYTLPGVLRYTSVPPDELLQTNAELLSDLVRSVRPAVLQATSPHLNGVLGLVLRNAFGVPLIYDVRGFPEMTWAVRPGGSDTEVYRSRREAETRCMVEADAVVTLSQVMKDQIVSRGVAAERITIVPHAVDVERLSPRPPRQDLMERYGLGGMLTIGYVSSLLEYEGVDVLLHALAELTRERGDVAGLVVGDGPVLASLRELAGELGVADKVAFTGRVSFDEIADHYALLDVFVCPRKGYEVCRYVTPLKPFEAMAMGLCLVTSDVPALAELTNGGRTGRTFEADKPRDLARVLAELSAEPDVRRTLGEEGRRHIHAHHTVSAMAEASLAAIETAQRAATPTDGSGRR